MTSRRRMLELAGASWRLMLRAVARPTVLHDDYLEWLLLANAGMQHRGNLYLFDLAIQMAPEAPMLEIGSFCGLSTNIVQYLKRKHGRTVPLFTCDKWVFEGSECPLPAAALVSHHELRDFVIESFERSVRSFSRDDLPFTIEATSDEFFRAWGEGKHVVDVFGRDVSLGGELGFCFVDGNHSEEYVLRDFANCDRYLLPGGLILFDDSGDETTWDVRKVIRRIKHDDRYEVLAKNPNYLVRKLA
jgi:predicted O-methyltransferase YrrM